MLEYTHISGVHPSKMVPNSNNTCCGQVLKQRFSNQVKCNIACSVKVCWNGFEHGGDSRNAVTIELFVVQTFNLKFWKWQTSSQNKAETSLNASMCSGWHTVINR